MSLFMMVRQSKVGEHAANAPPNTSAQATVPSTARARCKPEAAQAERPPVKEKLEN
ncbi:hypothetical protein [Paraburkholderia sp. D1E]|uniref:hypothetical protein n=1 Tax=Paraburkholderia sp. D1E TaxID=3461398 RepID=UPI0040454265